MISDRVSGDRLKPVANILSSFLWMYNRFSIIMSSYFILTIWLLLVEVTYLLANYCCFKTRSVAVINSDICNNYYDLSS